MNFHSLMGAIVFLALGVLQLALFSRTLYPVLRWRHERAKTTQEHGIDPNRIMALVRIESLIIMPLLGLFLGERMKAMFG